MITATVNGELPILLQLLASKTFKKRQRIKGLVIAKQNRGLGSNFTIRNVCRCSVHHLQLQLKVLIRTGHWRHRYRAPVPTIFYTRGKYQSVAKGCNL
jgi:hypothetical protein